MASIYHSPEWATARAAALGRDGNRCTVARLIGGECHATLDVHHIVPVAEGGSHDLDNLITACHAHHPMLERLRRFLLREPARRRCPHYHPYPGGREACERKLNAAA